MNIKKYKRISIVGCSGSGKSTLAKKLGTILNIPVHHIDCYYWQPGQVKTERKILTKQIKKITKTKKWIIDGTYNATLKNRFKRSTLIIFLNFSTELCIESVLKRSKQKERIGIPEYFEENNESLGILVDFIKQYPLVIQKHILPLTTKYKNKVLELTNRAQADELVLQLTKQI